MRGKRHSIKKPGHICGITPAHAGKTRYRDSNSNRYRDHPRACGENVDQKAAGVITSGSPPRMRGKPGRAEKALGRCGITPAHAGKTSLPASRPTGCRDHPRACGENYCVIAVMSKSLGSPPRMRGKLKPRVADEASGGITPAHAGKTRPATRCHQAPRDHPRACGENGAALQ
mgnify:CR=1 FL=1